METNELMPVKQDLYISPVVEIDDAKAKFEQVRKYTASCLTKGIDYGKIEGVSTPTLLKPGAEKIGSLFGLSPKFECVDKVMNFTGEGNPGNEPFFYFEYRCNLYKCDQFVASCDGSCNSWEKKYRYRKGGLKCPNCGRQTIMRSKFDDGYYCNAKRGGCGSNFKKDDTRITKQSQEDTINYDTAEQVNTLQKMAQKRAYVGAILIACNLSEYYTQDIEDMADFATDNFYEGEFTQVAEDQPGKEQQTKPAFDEYAFLMGFFVPENLPYIAPAKAANEVDSHGNRYGDIPTDNLAQRLAAVTKSLKRSDLTQDQRDEKLYKLSVICAVLSDRKAKIAVK